MPPVSSPCLFVVALAAEARPLIEHFRLKLVSDSRIPYYANESVSLVLTGIGKMNAAAATAAALVQLPDNTVCVNVGIAGSDREIGELVMAGCVRDEATERCWYPSLSSNGHQIDAITIVTVDAVSTGYDPAIAFDMEASGYCNAALKFSCAELVHSLKIISDNPQAPATRLTAAEVSTLVGAQIDSVQQIVENLRLLAGTLDSKTELQNWIQSITANIHFTATQQHQLSRLLERHIALKGKLPDDEEFARLNNASSTIKALAEQLANHAPTYQ